MSLYDVVAAIPGGARALASARLRGEAMRAIYEARGKTEELPRRLTRRKCNIRINDLADALFDEGFEVRLTVVPFGTQRAEAEAEMEALRRARAMQ